MPVILYLATVIPFLVLDAVMLKLVMAPLFRRFIGPLMLEMPRLAPAALFYLAYVAGLLWMVSWPALKAGDPLQALVGGLVLGALCYGTYEMTNYATLAAWNWQQVVIDGLWGTALTGFAAWAGVAVMSGRWG